MATTQKTHTLVTGASSGIGLEIAKLAARDGDNLVIVARNRQALEELADELKPAAVLVVAADLSQPGAAEKLVATLRDQNISIDTLVNNAGFGDVGEFAHSDFVKQQQMIQLNITTLTELTRLLIPEIKLHHGRIMNVGSMAGFAPGPLMSVYFASKAYVLSFSEALHEELKDAGVRVSCLCPGPTKTNFGTAAHASSGSYLENTRVTAASVAKAGWQGLHDGKAIVIPGLLNTITVNLLLRFAPRSLVRRAVLRINR